MEKSLEQHILDNQETFKEFSDNFHKAAEKYNEAVQAISKSFEKKEESPLEYCPIGRIRNSRKITSKQRKAKRKQQKKSRIRNRRRMVKKVDVVKNENMTIFEEVQAEMDRQVDLFGEQNHLPVEWVAILGEEFGEVSKEALQDHFKKSYGYEGSLDNYRVECIQVAAVAISMAKCYDRNKGKVNEKNDKF